MSNQQSRTSNPGPKHNDPLQKKLDRRILHTAYVWRFLSHVSFGFLLIAAGAALFALVLAFPKIHYKYAEALYIRQVAAKPFLGPPLTIEVGLAVKGSHVTAHVYPNSGKLSPNHIKIPVKYAGLKDGEIYYNGRGGDYYGSPIPSWLNFTVGTIIFTIGLGYIISALMWRRRAFSVIRNGKHGHPVKVHWHKKGWLVPTEVTAESESGARYAWQAIPGEMPSVRILRFLSSLAKVGRRPAIPSAGVGNPAVAELLTEPRPHRWLVLRTTEKIVLPGSLAEPVLGSEPVALPADQQAILSAHRRLLTAYAETLTRAAGLPTFVCPPMYNGAFPALHEIRTFLCWRPLIRFMVELHIRRQLRRLSSAYVAAQFLVPGLLQPADDERKKILELRDECRLFGDSLTDFGRRLISLFVGLATVIAAILPFVRLNTVRVDIAFETLLLWTARLLLFAPGILALTAYTDWFRCKRRLFSSEPHPNETGHHKPESVYQLEDRLFEVLGQQKVRERPVDIYAYVLVLLVWVAYGVWLYGSHVQISEPADWLLVGIVALIATYQVVKTVLRRKNQER